MHKNYRFRKHELFMNMDFLISGHLYLDFSFWKISQKTIYYNKMREIKGILLKIILAEAASKRGYHGTGMGSQTK